MAEGALVGPMAGTECAIIVWAFRDVAGLGAG